ncbi:hypothetical protein EV121DRAFT_289359 [Schizophyllum commune]
MSFPDSGSYYTFRLDPVASLQDIEDEQVIQAARKISPQVYVACRIKTIGAPRPPPAYSVAYIALVQQGLPPDDPSECLESRMCVPIRPNTQHPEGRRPAHCCHPLPWDGCYHTALHRMRVRIKTENRPANPPHSLAPSECVVLGAILNDDEERRRCLRNCAAKGVTPPPASLGEMALVSMRLADTELSDVPYWQIMDAEDEAERLAWEGHNANFGASVHLDDIGHNASSSSSASTQCAPEDVARETVRADDVTDARERTEPAESTHPEHDEQDDSATDETSVADDIADVENDVRAAFAFRADLRDLSPVIVPLSYDLSTLTAPPSPTGFMEELAAIRKIRSDYEERVRMLKAEVQRRDDEYMADIQARRTGESPVQSKWPLLGGFVPFTNRVKARFVCVAGDQLTVEGTAKDTEIADVLVRLEALEVVMFADGLVAQGIAKFASPDEVDIMIDIINHDL